MRKAARVDAHVAIDPASKDGDFDAAVEYRVQGGKIIFERILYGINITLDRKDDREIPP